MARDADETRARQDEAVKQVRFEVDDLSYFPNEQNAPKTKYRRRSTEAKAMLFELADGTAGRESLDVEANFDEVPLEEATYPRFQEVLKTPDGFRYTLTSDDIYQDLFAKINNYAKQSGNGEFPGVPFRPMTASGKRAFENCRPTITVKDFQQMCEQDMDAMFTEFKLRAFMAMARDRQMQEAHRTAKDLDLCLGHVIAWAEHFGQQMTLAQRNVHPDEEVVNLQADLNHARAEVDGFMERLEEQNVELIEAKNKARDAEARIQQYEELLRAKDKILSEQTETINKRNATIADMADDHRRRRREHDSEMEEVRRSQREATVQTQNTVHTSHTRGTEATTGTKDGRRSGKVPDPPLFYADKKKDEVSYEVWERDIRDKLSVNADHFADDQAMRVYVTSRLAGQAKMNLDPYLREEHPDRIKTTDELLTHLANEYQDPNLAEKALHDFNSLNMKVGDDFKTFKNKFVRLAGQCRKPKSEWKSEFKRRLTTGLKVACTAQGLDTSVNFDAFARYAAEVDNTWNQAREDKEKENKEKGKATTGGYRGGSRGGQGRGGFRTGGSGATSSTNSTGLTRPSAEEVKKLMAENRCFVCREIGHTSRQCPKNPRAKGATVSSVNTDPRVQAVLDYHFGRENGGSNSQSSVNQVTPKAAEQIPKDQRVVEIDDDSSEN
jgi:hypothetical protein